MENTAVCLLWVIRLQFNVQNTLRENCLINHHQVKKFQPSVGNVVPI